MLRGQKWIMVLGKHERWGEGWGLFTYPESSSSELIQAEGGNPLFDCLPLLSSCGGQKKKKKKTHTCFFHLRSIWNSAQATHTSRERSGKVWSRQVTRLELPSSKKNKNSFLLPDAKLFQESKCRVLKDILTGTVEHSLPLTSAMIKMLSKMQHCRAPSPGECATSHLSMNRRLSGCQRKW